MKKRQLFAFLISGALIVGLAFLYGCGANPTSNSNGSTAAALRSYNGTQSPGDVWSWSVNSDNTFSAVNSTKNWNLSGTYTSLPSGFCKATISSSNTTDCTVGSQAYFLEIPNTMLLVKPITSTSGSSSDRLIVCAAAASSLPPTGQYNFIQMPYGGAGWSVNSPAYGTVEVTSTSSVSTFDVRSYTINDAVFTDGTTVETGFSYNNGTFSSSGSSLEVFMTPSGIFIGDNGSDRGGFAGVSNSTGIDIADVKSKTYRGVLFKYDYSGGGNTMTIPVGATFEANGWLHGGMYDDIATNEAPDYATTGVTLR